MIRGALKTLLKGEEECQVVAEVDVPSQLLTLRLNSAPERTPKDAKFYNKNELRSSVDANEKDKSGQVLAVNLTNAEVSAKTEKSKLVLSVRTEPSEHDPTSIAQKLLLVFSDSKSGRQFAKHIVCLLLHFKISIN